jgi:protein-S-isoprenylcysteine O-methyltransferase Ste14
VLASFSIKKWLQKKLKKKYNYYRLAYTIFSFVFLTGLLYYQINLPTIRLYQPGLLILIVGAVLGVSGLLLMLICIKKYFMSLSGLQNLARENHSTGLLITGVHRYVRHPLYLGTFGFIWGLLFIFPYLSLFIANGIVTVYTLIGIKLEEQKLIMEFGEEYKQYQKRVPKLIPYRKAEP